MDVTTPQSRARFLMGTWVRTRRGLYSCWGFPLPGLPEADVAMYIVGFVCTATYLLLFRVFRRVRSMYGQREKERYGWRTVEGYHKTEGSGCGLP